MGIQISMISVCMTSFNGEKYIEKQLDTVRLQTVKPDQVILCDDCSKDNTVEVVRKYIEKYSLQDSWKVYKNEENLVIVMITRFFFGKLHRIRYPIILHNQYHIPRFSFDSLLTYIGYL